MELTDREFVNVSQEEKANYACFYNHAVKNENASQAAGHDIWIDKVYIMIVSPGQNKTEVRRPMQELDKRKYPTAWKAFEEKAESPVVGTPINYLPGLSLARLEELKGLNVRTVEQMASLSHSGISALGMGANELQQKAQAFLQKNTPEIVELRQQVADLSAKLAAFLTPAPAQAPGLDGPPKPRRGRPPKVALG